MAIVPTFVDKNATFKNKPVQFESQWFYGRLDLILVCTLPAHYYFRSERSQCLIFALVEANGKDASSNLVTYFKTSPLTIIDLAAVCGVVGRIQVGTKGRWGIIDRIDDIPDMFNEKDPEMIEEILEEVG